MANEDFTSGYTELDALGHLSQTASTSTYAAVINDQEACYLSSDKGAGNITGNFRWDFDFVSTSNGNNAEIVIIAAAQSLGTLRVNALANLPELSAYFYCPSGGNYNIYLDEIDASGQYDSSASGAYAASTTLYCTFRRDTSVGTYGTLYLDIYSDSGRSTLLETVSLTLHSNNSYRYVMTPQSYRTGGGNGTTVSGSIANLNLSAVPPTSIKTVKGLAKASVKTVNGLAIASVKSINALT